MSTQSRESTIDVQKAMSRSFKNNGECCILSRPMQRAGQSARPRSRCSPYSAGQPVPTGCYEKGDLIKVNGGGRVLGPHIRTIEV